MYGISSSKMSNVDDEGKTHTVSVQSSVCDNVHCTLKIPTECECPQTTSTAECGKAIVSSTKERPPFQVAGRSVKTKFDLSKVEGGRFILKSTLKRGGSEGASKNIIGDSDDRNIGVS